MNQAYNEISPATGAIVSNICSIWIMPVEWLAKPWKPAFATGVVGNIDIAPGRSLLNITLVQPTYNLDEKNRNAKGIDSYEISLTADTNDLSAETMQVLNTYRYHQWMIIYKDAKGRYKIAGNKNAGFLFSYDNAESNEKNEQRISASFIMQAEHPARFMNISPDDITVLPKLALIPGFDVLVNVASDGLKIMWGSLAAYPSGTTYVLQKCIYQNFASSVQTLVIAPLDFTNSYYNDTDVLPNQTYYYRMKAVKAGYVDSDWAKDNGRLSVDGSIINEGLVLLLDAETNVSWTLNGSDKEVDNWVDQIQSIQFDNVNDLLLLVNAAGIGGKPVVTNTGRATASMQTTDAPSLADPVDGMTIFVVGAQHSANDEDGCFIQAGNNLFLSRYGNATKVAGTIKSINPVIDPTVDTVEDDTFYTFRLMTDGANLTLAINNDTPISRAVVSSFWVETTTLLFSGAESNKSIAFVAVYNRTLTASEINQMELYLKTYYGHY